MRRRESERQNKDLRDREGHTSARTLGECVLEQIDLYRFADEVAHAHRSAVLFVTIVHVCGHCNDLWPLSLRALSHDVSCSLQPVLFKN